MTDWIAQREALYEEAAQLLGSLVARHNAKARARGQVALGHGKGALLQVLVAKKSRTAGIRETSVRSRKGGTEEREYTSTVGLVPLTASAKRNRRSSSEPYISE